MQCAEFEQMVNRLLDDRRSPRDDETLRTHANVCSDCADLLNAHERLLEMIDLTRPPLPRDFALRTVTKALAHGGSRQVDREDEFCSPLVTPAIAVQRKAKA